MIDANAMLQVQFIQRMQEMFLTFDVKEDYDYHCVIF